jgi:hypothetical protein
MRRVAVQLQDLLPTTKIVLAYFDLTYIIINMDKKLTGRGGPGRGQGRKPAPEAEAMVQVNVMLQPTQKEKLKRLGGAPWVRKKIDQAKE